MGRRKNPSHPLILGPGLRNFENFKMDVLLYWGLAFSGSLGEKTAEHRLPLLAPAFGALVLLFIPLFYGKKKGILFAAILALELVGRHRRTSFKIFLLWTPVPRRTPDLALRFLWSENRLPTRVLTSAASKTVDKYGSRPLSSYGIQSRSASRNKLMKLLMIFRLQIFISALNRTI
jgi:hypothetical protein